MQIIIINTIIKAGKWLKPLLLKFIFRWFISTIYKKKTCMNVDLIELTFFFMFLKKV